MKSKVLNCGNLILFLLAVSVPVFGKSILEVTVLDQNGNPVQKAKVSAQGVKSGKVKDEKTGNDGIAQLKKLDDDYYRVWARQDGYSPAIFEFVQLQGEAQESLELTLKPGNEDQKLYFEDNQVAEQASQFLMAGSQALQKQQFDQAETSLKQALEINPSQPVTYQNLGILYYQRKEWSLAKEYLQKAVDYFTVYVAIQPNPTLEQQLAQVKEMVKLLPFQQLAAEADDALNKKNYDLAVGKLRQLSQLQPENAAVFYNMTLALARANRMEEAHQAIDKAIELEPQNQSFKDTKNDLYQAEEAAVAKKAQETVSAVDEFLQAGQFEEAMAKAEEARQSVPEEFVPVLWIASARAAVQLDRPDEASAAFRKAIELVPEKIEYRRELADYLFRLERYEDAFGVFKEVWELSSEPLDESFFNLGQDLIKRGKQDMARKAFEEVLATNPNYAEAYYELGMEYFYGLEDRPKALEMLKKYVEIGQDEAHLSNANNVIVVIEKGH
jgi:superkiller protein 3